MSLTVNDPYNLTNEDGPMSAWNFYDSANVNWAIEESTKILDTLDPTSREKFVRMYQKAFGRGILPLYFSGRRGFDEQNRLYQKYLAGGRLAAPPGRSYNNYGMAVDTIVLATSGDGQRPGGLSAMQMINKELDLGLNWGQEMKAPYHFTDPYLTIKELMADDPAFHAWKAAHPEVEAEQQHIERQMEHEAKQKEDTWLDRNANWFVPMVLIAIVAIIIFAILTLRQRGTKT